MSKYCPIADAVTNCTDNCKQCLAEEKRYTLYVWYDGDEGGYGVCKKDAFLPQKGRREKVGDFDTAEELARLIIEDDACYTKETAMGEAKSLFDELLEMEE